MPPKRKKKKKKQKKKEKNNNRSSSGVYDSLVPSKSADDTFIRNTGGILDRKEDKLVIDRAGGPQLGRSAKTSKSLRCGPFSVHEDRGTDKWTMDREVSLFEEAASTAIALYHDGCVLLRMLYENSGTKGKCATVLSLTRKWYGHAREMQGESLHLCLSVSLPVSVSVCVSLSLSLISVSLSLCLCPCLCVCLSHTHSPIHLFTSCRRLQEAIKGRMLEHVWPLLF